MIFFLSYDSLSFYKIKSLPVPKLASNGALVIVWVTNKKNIINFVKEELFPSWNVELVADWHWVKVIPGTWGYFLIFLM